MQLGRKLWISGFAIRPYPTDEQLGRINDYVCRACHVTAHGEAGTWHYGPHPDAKTVYQPIRESGIVAELWPELGGAYYVVFSCKVYDPNLVEEILRKQGFEVVSKFRNSIALPRSPWG